MSLRPETRKKSYKNAIDAEEGRRRREEQLVKIRKEKRENNLRKKRCDSDASPLPLSLPSETHLKALVEGVRSPHYATQLEAIVLFRKILTSILTEGPATASMDMVVQAGVIPYLVEFLGRDDQPQLQFEAARTLANVACGTSHHTLLVIESGAIPLLVDLLASPNQDVKEQAVTALGNISADSPRCKHLVLLSGALLPLLSQFNPQATLSLLRRATWTLSTFFRGNSPINLELIKPTLSVLARLINCTDEEILTDACWALSYLSDVPQRVHLVIEAGVCPRLLDLLQHPLHAILLPALQTVGNMVAGDDVETQFVIDKQVLPRLHQLLTQNHDKSILRELCWTISNITAGNRDQIQAVIEANIIPPLVHLAQHAEFDVKKEATRAICNTTCAGSNEQIKFLTTQGCIEPLCDLLGSPDPNVVAVCLEGLHNILRVGEAYKEEGLHGGINTFAQIVNVCGGLEKIGHLHHHDNDEICDMATMIFHKFWKDDESEELILDISEAHPPWF